MIDDGNIEDNAMIKEKLTEWERKTIERLHPVYMGGNICLMLKKIKLKLQE